MPLILDSQSQGFNDAFDNLLSLKREVSADVDQTVSAIIQDIKERKDEALFEYTKRFDKLVIDQQSIRISPDEINQAFDITPSSVKDALNTAKERIEAYHIKQKPEDLLVTDKSGTSLGWRWTAVESAGLYVPGGTASYPSSVLMNAVPAKVAGISRLIMCVPAPSGKLNPTVLAAARIAGVDEIYRVGGAQAVAAMAFGTQSIKPVHKIVGPGNAYVAAAKRQIFGSVGIDMIAGPSEVLIIADGSARADWIALDLMAQAEHDTAAQSILITDSRELAGNVSTEVEKLLEILPRKEIAGASWRDYGAIILVSSLKEAIPLANRIAPEHLELETVQADDLLKEIRNAGSIFIGSHTPEAIGDYIAGPNHVLPTARSARFSSGLNVLDFMKRSSILRCTAESLREIGPYAVILAETEGLDAHALSVKKRLEAI